jgi:hypothetical protein
LALPCAAARADLIAWSYNWSPATPAMFADRPGAGKVTLSNEPAAAGNSDMVASNLKAFSSADPLAPATLTHQSYGLTLTLTDTTSGASGSLTFTGELNGGLSAASSGLTIAVCRRVSWGHQPGAPQLVAQVDVRRCLQLVSVV